MCSLGEGYLPPIGNMARGGSRANLKGAVDNGGVFSSKEISKVSSSKGAQNLQIKSSKGAPDLFQLGEGEATAPSCPLNPPQKYLMALALAEIELLNGGQMYVCNILPSKLKSKY